MKIKIYVFLFCFVASLTHGNAQRVFEVHDITDENNSFDGKGSEGGVVLCCKSDLNLAFESNLDDKIVLEEVAYDDEKNETNYCLVFTRGKRTLTVRAEGYNPIDISLNVVPDHVCKYQLIDPDDKVDDSYFERQRKNGQYFFDKCDYYSAREAFRNAARATKATKTEQAEVLQRAADCDSIMKMRKLGYLAIDQLDYEAASEYFTQAMRYNPNDVDFQNQFRNIGSLEEEKCMRYLSAGDEFFAKKEYEDAIEMYKKVEERNCEEAADALVRRMQAERQLIRKNNFDRYFGCEFGKTLGVTFATCRRTTGGYFTIKANSELFKIAQSKRRIEDHASVEMSFGWTFPIYAPKKNYFRGVWFDAGIGGAAVNQFSVNETDESKLDLEFGFAATPEAALMVKVWHFAVRATAQYRFIFNEKYDDLIGPRRLYVGVGYCW